MAEEVQQSEEDLWDNTPEYGEDTPVEEPVPQDADSEEEEEEEIERDYEEDEVDESEEDSPPEKDWEERYRNLESSHSRRGNEVHGLKEERDSLRLEKLEIAQRLQEIEASGGKKSKEEAETDPYDDEQFWSEEEKTILKEYPDVFAVANKIAQREAAKSVRGAPAKDSSAEIAELREIVTGLGDHFTRNRTFEQLDEKVGAVWREIDKDDEFFEFVNAKKFYYRAMSEGDLEEKAEVFNAYLDSEKGRRKYSNNPETVEEQPTSPTPHQNQRREAAQGLVSGKKSRGGKPRGVLTGDDLWDSIPDPE